MKNSQKAEIYLLDAISKLKDLAQFPSDATVKRSLHHWELASLNPADATPVRPSVAGSQDRKSGCALRVRHIALFLQDHHQKDVSSSGLEIYFPHAFLDLSWPHIK